MKSKDRERRNRLKKELAWLDPDQELVLKEDSGMSLKPETLRESLSRGVRSIIAVIICLVIPALWYVDWNPSAFADRTSEVVTGFFEEGESAGFGPNGMAPLPPLPDVDVPLDGNMVDFASALNAEGLLDEFSSPAVRAFYENGVTVDYLLRLREAGLIKDFSFPAVVAFYQNNIPLDYLTRLKSENLLDVLSFPAITAFYENDITIDYLLRFHESGFLEQTSFPAVVAYFQNGVTIEFLQQLQERDLLDQLSFPSVVDMYRNQ